MNVAEERRVLEDVIRKLDRQENENLPQVQLGSTEVKETPRTCLVWQDENFSALIPFALVTRRSFCPGRPKKLCFTTLSLTVETMGVRLGVVKQSFFGLPGQYGPFAFVTRRPYCPGRPKKLCFTTPSLTPMVSTARLSVVKQSFSGLPGQYGRHVTRTN